MGVPGLWPFIQTKFRYAIKHFLARSRRYQFDYVYLDANGLLHAAAQLVEHYGEYENKRIDNYESFSQEEKFTAIFELFFKNILEIVEMVHPRKVLYIAIDGPAPRAKQNQQRERRFISARDRKIKDEIKNTKSFDSSSISPGTEFMHKLSAFMYWKIREYINTRGDWQGIDVIYSPPTVPGEGEHKILSYIRKLPEHDRNNLSHCMFGPDGDLLILSLSVHVKKMSLFREDQFEKGHVDLVDMNLVRQGLAKELGQIKYLQSQLRYRDDVSNDFAFIGFFVGNDFLPKIKMFYNLKDGLAKMFNLYSNILYNSGPQNYPFITKGVNLELLGLRKFFQKLSESEQQFISSQVMITAPEPKFVDNTLLKHVDNSILESIKFGNSVSSDGVVDMKGYKKSYYEKAGVTNIKDMCKDYLRNLIWVYKYYAEDIPSWNDAYTWHCAPLMKDFSNYINNITESEFKNISNFDAPSHPALPFEQLLSILAPYSNLLLPEEYRTLMTNPNSPLVKIGYYPESFEIDYEGKFKDHQGIALLPFVDYETVSSAYNEIYKKSKYKYHKNTLGTVYSFRKTKGCLYDFYSDYGTIIDCSVLAKKL